MTLRHTLARRRLRRRGPIATIVAVMTACGVMIIGLIVGLEPFTICRRAAISALILGGLVSFGLSVIDIANTTDR